MERRNKEAKKDRQSAKTEQGLENKILEYRLTRQAGMKQFDIQSLKHKD